MIGKWALAPFSLFRLELYVRGPRGAVRQQQYDSIESSQKVKKYMW